MTFINDKIGMGVCSKAQKSGVQEFLEWKAMIEKSTGIKSKPYAQTMVRNVHIATSTKFED